MAKPLMPSGDPMTDPLFAPPLVIHRETVRPDWIDYNGHMNVAFYVMAFDHATDGLFDALGIGAEYCRRENRSVFAVEQHIAYRRELKQGEDLVVSSQLLGFDDKRLHFFQRMARDGGGRIAATMESLGLHVDMTARRAAPFPQAGAMALAQMMAAQAGVARPPESGRGIGQLAISGE